ncbi:MAG: hypothetical protein Q8L15_02255 [Methylobacter sp.]|nr:hypothetical protein [Methylobacter sp.]
MTDCAKERGKVADFTVKGRQSLLIASHKLIVFNGYSVFVGWKNGAE